MVRMGANYQVVRMEHGKLSGFTNEPLYIAELASGFYFVMIISEYGHTIRSIKK